MQGGEAMVIVLMFSVLERDRGNVLEAVLLDSYSVQTDERAHCLGHSWFVQRDSRICAESVDVSIIICLLYGAFHASKFICNCARARVVARRSPFGYEKVIELFFCWLLVFKFLRK